MIKHTMKILNHNEILEICRRVENGERVPVARRNLSMTTEEAEEEFKMWLKKYKEENGTFNR